MADDPNLPEPQNQPDPEPQAGAHSISGQEIPPVVEKRKNVHNIRIPPLQESAEYTEVVTEETIEMDRAIEEMCSRVKGEHQTREEMNGEIMRLREVAGEAERKLAEAESKIRERDEKIALIERQEELFAEEHRRHDTELQQLIEKNRDLSKKQLELVREIMRKHFSKT